MKNSKKCFIVTIILFAIVLFCNFAIAQNKPEPPKPEPKVQQIAGLNTKFIVALISDGGYGAWIGTEDEGVFHYNGDGKITQYTTKNGLADNNGYALAIDKLGRLWVGHLNTGVSVFNGETWQNYDVVDGPIGERIFDIKICPKDGDVWLATSAGITRYKIDTDEWEHFTREDGLLEDQVAVLAFKFDGTLIVGTQCHGLAIFNRNVKGEYKHAKDIVAPDRFGLNNCSPVPLVPMGAGLPSNLVNDILVTKNSDEQTIWIATNAGLVKANESLTKLEYWRGKDYAGKVRGLYGGAPKDWKEAPKEIMDQLLSEDYLTCLEEDDQGVVWIGTRQNGTMVADPKTGKKSLGNQKAMGYPDSLVTKILNLGSGDYLVGFYGGGIVKPIKPFKLVDRKPAKTKFNKGKIYSVAQNDFSKLPIHQKTSTEKLRTMFYEITTKRKSVKVTNVLNLNDDWRTQGNWIDCYGNHSAVFCGQGGGGCDFHSGYFLHELKYAGWIGGNYREKDDQLRRWVHWIESNDRRVLQCETLGGRKQAEWDDHKEAYPITLDGPHIYGTFKIPAGKYVLSLYFFNKDGHEGTNRLRDFRIAVKVFNLPEEKFRRLGGKNINAEREFLAAAGVSSRVRDFWGGVYKRFYVEVGKNDYVTIKIDANYSFNTILSGVFFDPAGEMKSHIPLYAPDPPPRKPTEWAKILENPVEDLWWSVQSMDRLLCLRDTQPIWFYQNSRKRLLSVVRGIVKLENNKPKPAEKFDQSDRELIRRDVARVMNHLQLYDYRDLVDYYERKHISYWWDGRTKVGRKNANNFDWDSMEVEKFINKKRKEQSW